MEKMEMDAAAVLARMARVVATMTAEAAKIVPASPVMDAPTPPWQREIQVARMGVASDDTKTFDRDRLKDTHTHTTIARPTSGIAERLRRAIIENG